MFPGKIGLSAYDELKRMTNRMMIYTMEVWPKTKEKQLKKSTANIELRFDLTQWKM